MTIEQRTIAEVYDHIAVLKREIKARKRQVRALKEFIEANRPPRPPMDETTLRWAQALEPTDTPFLNHIMDTDEPNARTVTWGSLFPTTEHVSITGFDEAGDPTFVTHDGKTGTIPFSQNQPEAEEEE
jgi:hypothetical protein